MTNHPNRSRRGRPRVEPDGKIGDRVRYEIQLTRAQRTKVLAMGADRVRAMIDAYPDVEVGIA